MFIKNIKLENSYQTFVPQLNLISQTYDYGSEYYNYVNNDYTVQLPTQEELERARQYQSKVPDYQISSAGGNMQAGVIIDNPGYSSYNASEPPAAFAAVGGNVALAQDQVNANGTAPAGFGNPGFQFNIAPSQDPNAQQPQQGYPPQQQGYGYQPPSA